ncbi:MAG: hypothetical protein DRQ44_04560, partial [Gammaproteobacteria bacterium]
LLVLVIVIFLAVSTFYLTSVSVVEIKVDKAEKTQAVLKRARQALLDYAVSNWRRAGDDGNIGRLPCPDYNDNNAEGEQDGACGNAYANAIGYLPWRKLGLERLIDSSGSCLLYAVSPAYKNSPESALSPDSFGQFRFVDNAGMTLQGVLPEDRPVAVIIAPGSTLPGQVRQSNAGIFCGSYYGNDIATLIAAYLDNNGVTNNAGIDPATDNVIENIVDSYPGSDEGNNPLNDRVITITHREFWAAVQDSYTGTEFEDKMEYLTEALTRCLVKYAEYNFINSTPAGKKSLPWPAALNVNGNEYRNSFSYDDNPDHNFGHAGRLPYQVSKSNGIIGNGLASVGFIEYGFCSAIVMSDASIVNLNDINGEYWNLWSNWKESFFYVLSTAYDPDNDGSGCGSCIQLNGDKAGIVFYAGEKQPGQQRYSPPFDAALAIDAVDDKDEVSNYLENNNAADFPDDAGNLPAGDGSRTFEIVSVTSNDIMFCIAMDASNNFVVSECL